MEAFGHDATGSVVNSAGDFAGGRLGGKDRAENTQKHHPQISLHLDIPTQRGPDSKRYAANRDSHPISGAVCRN
jgi:hypothetical protein